MAHSTGTYKRIAFVSNNAWSVYNFRLQVIRFLRSQGHEVIVFAPEDDFVEKLKEEGCLFISIDFNNKSENPLSDLVFHFRLWKLYGRYRPDMIFHYVAKPNIYGTLAAARRGIPSVAVVTGLGYAFAKKNWLYFLVSALYRYALEKANEVWFLNNEDARVFIDERIVAIEKVKVLPGEGVDTAYFSPPAARPSISTKPFTFLMSARLLRSKGIGVFADAARLLRKKNYDVQCELIGFFEKNHPDSIPMEEINRWQKEGLVQYRGFQKDVRSFLSDADCFVFPSYYNEGVPRSLMEAASMELPVITSHNRGCKEVVLPGQTGFLCNVHDPFDLADKMEKMILLPTDQRVSMGKSGRAWVHRKFDVQKVVQEYADTLERFLGKGD
jgi:glycosyltransferase involved in cell wall biosynthesis